MKWLSLLSVLALTFVFNACEMHPTSDSPGEEAKEFGKYEKGGEEKAEAKPAAESGAAAKPEAAATPEAKKGDAPKYFPESNK